MLVAMAVCVLMVMRRSFVRLAEVTSPMLMVATSMIVLVAALTMSVSMLFVAIVRVDGVDFSCLTVRSGLKFTFAAFTIWERVKIVKV